MDLFAPSHLLIILLVLVLLFGSAKLPKLAKSLGESMRIFKGEAQKMHTDKDTGAPAAEATAQQQLPPPAPQPVVAPVAQPVAQQQPIVAPQPVVQPGPAGTPPASTPAPEAPQANQPG